MDGIEANLLAKRALMEDSSAPADDIAIFGDSKLFSLRPDAISDALGGEHRITNYSWPFFGMEAFETMLANYLRHRPAPRAIIINGRPEIIGVPASENSLAGVDAHRSRAFIALPVRDLITLAARQRRPGLLWQRLVWALQPPSTAYRSAAWDALRDLARGRGWPKATKDYQRMTTSFRDTGAFLMHRNRQITEAEVLALETVERPYAIYKNHAQAESFERFVSRASAAGIALYVLGSPAPPPYHERFNRLGIHDAHRALLAHWDQKFGNLHVIEPLHPVYPLDHFGDPGHLNTIGDNRFQSTYPALLANALKTIKGPEQVIP